MSLSDDRLGGDVLVTADNTRSPNATTILVAGAAGVAGMLAVETRASAASRSASR